MLRRCLESLLHQQIDEALLRMQVIVVDNDVALSARAVFDDVMGAAGAYVGCAEPGIPFARNAAVEAALTLGAYYIAFIDDDEVAPRAWLQTLFQALVAAEADAAQGEVQAVANERDLARRAAEPLSPSPACEEVESIATCNTLFKAWLVEPPQALRFDQAMRYTGGSDKDFFMRARKRGARVVRVRGAPVIEEIAEGRETLGYAAMRAFAAGNNYHLRISKNEPAPVAFRRIAGRVIERGAGGLIKVAFSLVLLLLLQRRQALRQLKRGVANLSFASGCVTPLVGVRAQPYRALQGA